MDSGSLQADFFLPSIALDFIHVRHALADGFPNPFVQLIFILIRPITAKDVVTSKRRLGDCTEVCLYVWIMWSDPTQIWWRIGMWNILYRRRGVCPSIRRRIPRSSNRRRCGSQEISRKPTTLNVYALSISDKRVRTQGSKSDASNWLAEIVLLSRGITHCCTAFACTATRTATPANFSTKEQHTMDNTGSYQAREGHWQTPANKACRVPPSALKGISGTSQARLEAA
jgi:hypothetical protein